MGSQIVFMFSFIKHEKPFSKIILKIILRMQPCLFFLNDYVWFLMMHFFNRNWAGGWKGRWAGPGLLVGWDAGSLNCLG